ncbi:hypothetical protein [Nosocomiicoccus massiliensis]|uniref:hypothetical protein n=1 Tax=Nosocomiicoccus massiliensis TaxID=1232430 RepID=UPI00040932E1|nr:hypothetical protein [Nosocomiicoccus massiliensis]
MKRFKYESTRLVDKTVVHSKENITSIEIPSSIHELFKDWNDDGIRSKEIVWGDPKGAEFK